MAKMTKKQIHKQYMRIAEIMVTDEYPSELDKMGAIRAVCDRVYNGVCD